MLMLFLTGTLAATAQSAPMIGEEISRRMGEAYRASVVSDCPDTGNSLRGRTTPLTCGCPAVDRDGLGTSVWGNGVYTDDSNICLAAIHDGRVSTSGGRVTVWAAPGQARYSSATRNGITSWDYQDFEGSFRFTSTGSSARGSGLDVGSLETRRSDYEETERSDSASDGTTVRHRAAGSAGSTGEPRYKEYPNADVPDARRAAPIYGEDAPLADERTPRIFRAGTDSGDCPEIGRSLRGTTAPLTCMCPAIARDMLGTSVWGTAIYTDDSNICLAAIHDGRVSLSGGKVTIWASPGRAVYRSSKRNGIRSIAYQDFEGSIQFSPPPFRARR